MSTEEQESLEELFAQAAAVGQLDARDLGFTLDPVKAREKLAQFTVEQAEDLMLLVVAGLYAWGVREFKITIDPVDFIIESNHQLARERFDELWVQSSLGWSHADGLGCRLIGLAILSSQRLKSCQWSIDSSDEHGPWQYIAQVRSSKVGQEKILGVEDGPTPRGLRLRLARQSLGRAILRFFLPALSLKSFLVQAGVQLLKRRLSVTESFKVAINGEPLSERRAETGNLLAALTTGVVPHLDQDGPVFNLERPIEISMLLLEPKDEASQTKGSPARKHICIHWVWNGLVMEPSKLAFEVKGIAIEAYVVADKLQPDLSFSRLADNKEKQLFERLLRRVVRELLERYARWLTCLKSDPEPIKAAHRLELGLVNSPELSELAQDVSAGLEVIRNAIAARVDTRSDPNRLGSLNKALTACPILEGWAEDGTQKAVSFREIWNEARKGAVFWLERNDTNPTVLNIEPGQGLVLKLSNTERRWLETRFREPCLKPWQKD